MYQFKIAEDLQELTEHRTTNLPIASYETMIEKHIQGYIPVHWHNELQFVYIVSGSATYQVNEDTIVVAKQEGIFINSGRVHMAKQNSEESCTYICINIDPSFVVPVELFTKYVQPYVQATNFSYVHLTAEASWAQRIMKSIRQLQQTLKKQEAFYELHVALLVNTMWTALIENELQLQHNEVEHRRNERLKQMLVYIHVNFTDKITLEQIAKSGQLSRSECCRYFQTMMQTSPMQYVLHYRIQQSLPLLKQHALSVTEIGLQVGFTSTSYFIERFKEVMRQTPLQYRKQL